MSRYRTIKIFIILASCFSSALLAVTQNNDLLNSQMSTSPSTTPKNILKSTASSRGQLLYENHCTTCHDSGINIREHRKARSLKDIHDWTYRWSQHLKLEWSGTDINDVVEFLNQRFYHFSR